MPKNATAAFERLLALSPKATLPSDTSPKSRESRFAAAQDYFKSHEPLKVKAETQSKPPSVTLVVQKRSAVDDREDARVGRGRRKRDTTLDGVGAIELPHGKRLDLRVAALDENGNRVVEVGSADVPLVIVRSG